MHLGRNPIAVMPLEIQIRKRSGAASTDPVTVALDGSLDTATAPDLEKELAPILESGVADVVFDLAELDFLSSAGLRVFAAVRKRLKERGGQVSFIHMQPRIREVFEIVKAISGLAVFRNQEELDTYLARRQRREK